MSAPLGRPHFLPALLPWRPPLGPVACLPLVSLLASRRLFAWRLAINILAWQRLVHGRRKLRCVASGPRRNENDQSFPFSRKQRSEPSGTPVVVFLWPHDACLPELLKGFTSLRAINYRDLFHLPPPDSFTALRIRCVKRRYSWSYEFPPLTALTLCMH